MKMIFILVFLLLCPILLLAQLSLSVAPRQNHFYARGTDDSARVQLGGTLSGSYDSAFALLFKNNVLQNREAVALSGDATSASFLFNNRIHAELSEYRLELWADTTKLATFDSLVCGDAFIVEGQSNAVAGYGDPYTYSNEFVRSFGSRSTSADTCGRDTSFCRAHAIASLSSQQPNSHGYVGKWALEMGRRIVDSIRIPVCLINGAVGSTVIGAHTYGISPRDTLLTTIYGRLYYRLKKAGLFNGITAFFWYQGESDNDSTSYYTYFDKLYKAWKVNCPNIKKFYLFQIHPGSEGTPLIREVHRKLPSKYSDVVALSTCGLPGHDGVHYSLPGYQEMGKMIYRLVARDFYSIKDSAYVTSPNIQKVTALNEGRIVVMQFDQPVLWPADSAGKSMWQGIIFDADTVRFDSVRVDTSNRRITLYLPIATQAQALSYPNIVGRSSNYKGRWLLNPRGVGALTFNRFPITYDTLATELQIVCPTKAPALSCFPNPMATCLNIKMSESWQYQTQCRIFNVQGECVQRVNISKLSSEAIWDGKDLRGRVLPAGFYTLVVENCRIKLIQRILRIH